MERIRYEVRNCAVLHGTKATLGNFVKKYPKYTFVRTSVNNGKHKIKEDKSDITVRKKE